MTCILAIDPGVTGALAFYLTDLPDRISVLDMPLVDGEINAAELRSMIEIYKPVHAIIEQVGPMPRDGVRQAWRFAAAYTTARVVVALLDIPMTLVLPGRWKKAMNVKGGAAGKEQCRALVIQKFPACAASFARKKDQGRAEAALLALYAAHLNSRKAAA
jgi:Holliday junction resolvasome RuvABC endonuclease subunit